MKNNNYNICTAGEETWLTPPAIINALCAKHGPFDLDPACPPNMPWRTAKKMLTKDDDGLTAKWRGEVFMNPPYGKETQKWVERLSEYNNGIALIFARASCKWFHKYVLQRANTIFFFDYRLRFFNGDGELGPASAPAPSCLVIYGKKSEQRLISAVLSGKLSGTAIKIQ